jgi:hypothetical protein
MLCHLDKRVLNKRYKRGITPPLTVHDRSPILDETMNNLQCLNCGRPSLVLGEPVEPLQDRLNLVLSLLHECDCRALSKANTSTERDSLDRPCLSSFVAKASVESNSTIILNTISCISDVAGTRVYIPTRMRKCSMDSSKSTSAPSLNLTPLAAWLTWMS